jgi:hypothetical protein
VLWRERGPARARRSFFVGVREDGSPTNSLSVQGTPHDRRMPSALGAHLGAPLPGGGAWAGLDTYFILQGMSEADARAHTRNCSLSELCVPAAARPPGRGSCRRSWRSGALRGAPAGRRTG